MSYRNPQQVVDTQSAQHFANLQNTISGTFQRVAKSYKAVKDAETLKAQKLAKERSERLRLAQLEEDEVLSKGDEVVRNNKSINIEGALNPYVGQYSELTDKIDNGGLSSDEVSAIKTKQRDIKALPGMAKTALQNFTMATVGLKEALTRPGKADGVDLYAPGYNLENTQVWTDKIAGTRDVIVEENTKTGRPEVFVVITPKGGESRRYSSAQLQLMAEENGGVVQRVPNQKVQWEAMRDTFLTQQDPTTKKLIPNDNAYGPMEINEDEETGLVTYSRPLKRKEVGEAASVEIAANVSSMSNNDLISLANNILGFQGSVNLKNLPEMYPLIEEEYKEHWLDSFANPQEEKSRPIKKSQMSITERRYYDDLKAKQVESEKVTGEIQTDVVDIFNNPSGFFEGLTIKGIGKIATAEAASDNKIKLRIPTGKLKKDDDTGDMVQDTKVQVLDLGSDVGIRQFAGLKYPNKNQKPEKRKFEKELMLYRDYQVAKKKAGSSGKLEDVGTYEEFKSKQVNKGDQIFK
jgi:hypothetical protein